MFHQDSRNMGLYGIAAKRPGRPLQIRAARDGIDRIVGTLAGLGEGQEPGRQPRVAPKARGFSL